MSKSKIYAISDNGIPRSKILRVLSSLSECAFALSFSFQALTFAMPIA